MPTRSTPAWIAVLVLAAIALGHSQEPTPVFRSSAEAVGVDVFVTDADGKPVSGLTIDDFEILENGQAQPVTTFEAVNLPVETTEADHPPAEPDVVSNDRPEGRIYVFALAVGDPCQALRTREFIHQFVNRHFGPNDVAAVVNLLRGLATDGQDFTSNRRLLLKAVDKFSGGFDECQDSPRGSAGRDLIASLRDVIEVLGRMPGRHKTMLYFNEGPGFAWGDLEDYKGGVGTIVFDDAHRAMTIATRSNITIYPIDPRGLTPELGGAAALEARQDLRALGEITGGFAHTNSNDFAQAFERIVRDASTFYMLGFNSAYTKNDGKFVRLDVRVKRPGMTVRTRSGYVSANRRERQAEERARLDQGPVNDALANPLTSSGYPMRVVAAAFKGAGDKANVVLTLETLAPLGERNPKDDTRSGKMEVHYITTDARRKVYPELRHIGNVTMPGRVADASGGVMRLVSQMELSEGRYQIRIAAGTERTGGSVVYDLEVPDFTSEPLMMSGLTLTSAVATTLPTLSLVAGQKAAKTKKCYAGACGAAEVRDMALSPWSIETAAPTHPLYRALPAAPTTLRTFKQGETVVVFGEIYQRAQRQTGLSVSAQIRRPDQSVVLTVSGSQGANDAPRASGGFGFTLPLPLANIGPGRYILYVEAQNASEERRTSRQIPLEVVP